MKIIKEGGHRLFETDPETARYVAEMLADLRRRGLDAVRDLSRKFDDWAPASFELSEAQIAGAIDQCPEQLIRDTEFCTSTFPCGGLAAMCRADGIRCLDRRR